MLKGFLRQRPQQMLVFTCLQIRTQGPCRAGSKALLCCWAGSSIQVERTLYNGTGLVLSCENNRNSVRSSSRHQTNFHRLQAGTAADSRICIIWVPAAAACKPPLVPY